MTTSAAPRSEPGAPYSRPAPSTPSNEPKHPSSPEMQPPSCHLHGPSQTPQLDAHLRQPSTKSHIHDLSSALGDVLERDTCSKCAAERAVRIFSAYLLELQATKKSGQWSKEEKRAMKAEVKGLRRDLKQVFKKAVKEDK